MDYVKSAIGVLLIVFTYILVIKLFMNAANFIGEKLGFGKLFMSLVQRTREKL